MQYLIRAVAVAYLVFLTVLLWTSDPARLVSWDGQLPQVLRWLMPAAHLLSFWVLGVLMLSARWSLPSWGVVLILATYAGLTEIVQGLLPSRTPEWIDWFQDMAGIALGAGLCWAAARWNARRRGAPFRFKVRGPV
jgi:VanZ family protein